MGKDKLQSGYPKVLVSFLERCDNAGKRVKLLRDYLLGKGKKKFEWPETKEVTIDFNSFLGKEPYNEFKELGIEYYKLLEEKERMIIRKLRITLATGTLLGLIALTIGAYSIYSLFRYKSSEYTKKVFEESYELLLKQKGILSDKVEEFQGQVAGLKEENAGLKEGINGMKKEISDYKGSLSSFGVNLESLQGIAKETKFNVDVLSEKYGELSVDYELLVKQFNELEARTRRRRDIENIRLKEESDRFKESLEKLLTLECPE